jgi:hypothetical protein
MMENPLVWPELGSFPPNSTVSLFMFNSSAVSLTSNLRSEHTQVRSLSTFASVLCVSGCPILGVS